MVRYQLIEHRDDLGTSWAWVRDTSDGRYSLLLLDGEDWSTTDDDLDRVVDVAAVESGAWDCAYDADEAGMIYGDDVAVLHEWDAA